jgi:hypothetical protein
MGGLNGAVQRSPGKFSAAAIATIGGDLWRYLDGGQEQAGYYVGSPASSGLLKMLRWADGAELAELARVDSS